MAEASRRRARAGIGFVPEGRQVFPNLTVSENLVATANRRGPWTLDDLQLTLRRDREYVTTEGSGRLPRAADEVVLAAGSLGVSWGGRGAGTAARARWSALCTAVAVVSRCAAISASASAGRPASSSAARTALTVAGIGFTPLSLIAEVESW